MRALGMAVLSLAGLGQLPLLAAVDPPARLEAIRLATIAANEAGGAVSLAVDPGAYARLWDLGAARLERIPLPGGEAVDLEIAAFELLSPEARFVVAGGGGWRETAAPAMRFFRGRVAGEPDSLVSLNLFDGRIAGFVRAGAREWTFAPRAFAPGRDGSSDLRIWSRDVEREPARFCEGEHRPPEPRPERRAPAAAEMITPAIDGTTLLTAKIAIEGTVEWTAMNGGPAGAQLYTLNLMSQVAAIYEAQAGVRLEIPFVLLNAAEPDGYSGESNDSVGQLGQMRAKWNGDAALRSVFRTVAHLFSRGPEGGAGTAYLDVLCDNVPPSTDSADFGVSLLPGNAASWERILTAHEIGHNFSSPHTHCYSPVIDRCYNQEAGCYDKAVVQSTGTIMSYCAAKDPTFHSRCIDEKIRPAAEAAFPVCIDVAGPPGDIRAQDGSALQVGPAPVCPAASLQRDDGSANAIYGWPGTPRAAWIKRFTPPCYPFRLTSVEVMIADTSIAVGRPLRLLVYREAGGLGSPAIAALAHAQDVTVQVVSFTDFNVFTLTTPVVLTSGDFYLGFYDLDPDAADSFPLTADDRYSGDSWFQPDSTDPAGYFLLDPGTWMIRGAGAGVPAGTLQLSWGVPCNNTRVPHQDYAVYQGTIGSWSGLASLTCSTQRGTSWLLQDPPPRAFWIVVPLTSENEGSYGQSSSGERPAAAVPCKPQILSPCN